MRYLIVSELPSECANSLCRALHASFAKGTFSLVEDSIYWEPPIGLGQYTFERVQAYAAGILIGMMIR
jgi:hypothetical protein